MSSEQTVILAAGIVVLLFIFWWLVKALKGIPPASIEESRQIEVDRIAQEPTYQQGGGKGLSKWLILLIIVLAILGVLYLQYTGQFNGFRNGELSSEPLRGCANQD